MTHDRCHRFEWHASPESFACRLRALQAKHYLWAGLCILGAVYFIFRSKWTGV